MCEQRLNIKESMRIKMQVERKKTNLDLFIIFRHVRAS